MANSITEAIRRQAGRWADRPALITDGQTISFAAFDAMWDAALAALRSAGVARGDRVLVRTGSHGDMFALVLACMELGAVAIPANPRVSPERIEAIGQAFGVTALATAVGTVNRRGHAAPPDTLPADTNLLIMTSGSSGQPKAVPVHSAMAARGVANGLTVFDMSGPALFLNYTPPSTVAGLLFAGLAVLSAGVTQICTGFQPLEFASIITRHRPTHTILLPVMMNVLRSLDSWGGLDLSCFEAVVTGSAPVFHHHASEVLRRGAKRFVHTYGMTECVPPVIYRSVTSAEADELVALTTFSSGWEHRLMPDGELMLKGEGAMRGYVGAPPGTGFIDGWFRTGDIFATTPAGMTFVGRADARLKINAWSVSPELTEAVILEVPGVNACAAVRKVGRSGAESLVAVVSGTAIDPAAILAHCRARLDSQQVPRRVLAVPQVPLNVMGKVDRNAAALL